MLRLSLLAAIAVIAAFLALPSAAPAAKYKVAVGIGDQSPLMFDNASFQALRVKKVRYFIRWNAIDNPSELALADAYITRAQQARAKVLLHISSDTLVRKKGKLPSLRAYRSKVGALVRRYRSRIDAVGVWNEANHDTQPTYKNPRRAAQFFLAMRKMCRGCKIVALDVLDQAGVQNYIARWFRALGRKRRLATIVGIHNYSDTNRYRDRGTRLILRTTKRYNRRAKFWLTETGGVIKFGSSFPCNPANPARAEKRQAKAIDYMFTLTRRFRRDIQRLYIYNFVGTNCTTRFDTGIVRADGSPRPAYNTVKREMRNFKR